MPSSALHATPAGTAAFASRFPHLTAAHFYRAAQGLALSSVGMGTYLGPLDEETDRGYAASVRAAIRAGVNLIDTSLNYRHQRSERAIGRALEALAASGDATRAEVVLATKAGYLVPGAMPRLDPSQVAAGSHSLAPAFLADQLGRSLENLRVDAVDIFYLHNPEIQLQVLDPAAFEAQMEAAFAECERQAARGRLLYYGCATWDGFRRRPGAAPGLDLEQLVRIAERVGGPGHRFRFIQLPFNLAMAEAITVRNHASVHGPVPVLEAAHNLGITVIGSASLLQGRLTRELPEAFSARFPGLATDAQRALQFARSTPGLTASLVGMSRPTHVEENLAVAARPPFSAEEYYSFYPRSNPQK